MRNFEEPGRSLAVGRNGMVATSHPAATLTGIEILKAGGNAMDAAIAACAVQGVVEAGSTGIGGDCFAMIAPGGSDRVVAYNGSGRTPAAMTPERLAALGVTEIERTSPHAVTVPGAVDAWTRLWRDHGRMPFAEVLAPAAAMAREGYAVTPRVAHDIEHDREVLAGDPAARRLFLTADGATPAVGTLQRQEALADTLDAIRAGGRDAFYRGPVAEEMTARLGELGGLHTRDDFATAEGEYVTPVAATYRGFTVHECPPNGQGVIALMILKILERFAPTDDPLDVDALHVQIEAARLAYAARDAVLADPAAMTVTTDELLSDALADRLAALIDPARALDAVPVLPVVEHTDTVYIAAVDRERNAVSLINSLFNGYGSGILAPRSGVLFHNRGMSFSLAAGHPNRVGPRKRPMHTIIPAMLTRAGRAVMAFGVMGGHYQAMGHATLLSRVLDHGLDLQRAMEAPRLFPRPGTKTVELEARLFASIGDELRRRGFDVAAPRVAIGGSQAILIDWDSGALLGGSDPRKDGCALGW